MPSRDGGAVELRCHSERRSRAAETFISKDFRSHGKGRSRFAAIRAEQLSTSRLSPPSTRAPARPIAVMNFPSSASAASNMSGAGAQDPGVKAVQSAMESCFGKSIMSGVMGFGMGGLFGMFMASMSYDTPFHTASPGSPASPVSSLPLKQQLKIGFKDMGTRSWSMAKNFGKVGALYSGIECGIEGLRAKNDITNAVAAGCVTGGVLAKNAGPQAAAGGCLAFAAFSAAIEVWMRSPKDE